MTHTPTLLDVASDLRRCIYASFDEGEFDNKNFLIFWNNAQKILRPMQNNLDSHTKKLITKQLNKSQNKTVSLEKRREDLLLVASLLQSYAQHQL